MDQRLVVPPLSEVYEAHSVCYKALNRRIILWNRLVVRLCAKKMRLRRVYGSLLQVGDPKPFLILGQEKVFVGGVWKLHEIGLCLLKMWNSVRERFFSQAVKTHFLVYMPLKLVGRIDIGYPPGSLQPLF